MLDEDDFQEEIRAHLKIAADQKIADGAEPDGAPLEALKEFGNVMLTTEAARRVWTPWWLEAFFDQVSDVRYVTRTLAKNPMFALTVVGVLTLGIGLNATVFTMLKSMAFSPIAGVDRSSQLATVFRETTAGRAIGLSYPDYQYVRNHQQAFVGLFGSSLATVGLGKGRASRALFTELVTGNYFQVLGVRAEHGRTLLPSDEIAPGQHPVVVLSDGVWRREFAADPDIVGKTLQINDYPLTVVGVADPSFHGTTVVYDVELYIPVMMAPDLGFTFGSRQTTPSGVISRPIAAPPSSSRRASGGPASPSATPPRRPTRCWPRSERAADCWSIPSACGSCRSGTRRAARRLQLLSTLTVLSVMGVLVLMIACANIAGLVLVQGDSRRGEIAVRFGAGSGPARIVRLLIVENLVLALQRHSGRDARVPRSAAGRRLRGGARRARLVFFNIGVDRLVNGFAVLVACGCALVFGFISGASRRGSIWSPSSTRTRRRAARRAGGCAPAS